MRINYVVCVRTIHLNLLISFNLRYRNPNQNLDPCYGGHDNSDQDRTEYLYLELVLPVYLNLVLVGTWQVLKSHYKPFTSKNGISVDGTY